MNPKITTILCDVGGVLGTNGWDVPDRKEAARLFGLDWQELEERHKSVVKEFELGRLNTAQYEEKTVFYQPRPFTTQEFRDFMFSRSRPFPESLAAIERVAQSNRYFLATLNNESLELNVHRIQRFGLRRYFCVFFSSCFLGLAKPDVAIYNAVLKLTQRAAEECLFIDDREENVESAAKRGMRTLHCRKPGELGTRLREMGIVS